MKITFLETSSFGLRWMKMYYRKNPQLDSRKASSSFEKTQLLLMDQPLIGHPFDDVEGVREIKIINTAFSILYAYKNDAIYVIDIRDQRGMRSVEAIREFNRHLREKYGL